MQANTSNRKPYLTFIALVLPVLVLRLFTAAYPLIESCWLSLTDTHLLEGTHNYVGLENYRQFLQDSDSQQSLLFTLIFIGFSTILELVLGLLTALFLNNKFRGRFLGRTINLIPWSIPTIVAAFAFQWLLDDQFGLISHWIHQATGIRPAILNSAIYAQITLILVNVWKNAPFVTVIFLAGLQGIPEELYEAAKIDGAGAWRRFFSITIPFMTPLLITMGLHFIIWQLASFDLVFGLTRGGPGIATTTLSLLIYQEGFFFFKVGYASAISVILMVIVAVIGFLGVICFRRTDPS